MEIVVRFFISISDSSCIAFDGVIYRNKILHASCMLLGLHKTTNALFTYISYACRSRYKWFKFILIFICHCNSNEGMQLSSKYSRCWDIIRFDARIRARVYVYTLSADYKNGRSRWVADTWKYRLTAIAVAVGETAWVGVRAPYAVFVQQINT